MPKLAKYIENGVLYVKLRRLLLALMILLASSALSACATTHAKGKKGAEAKRLPAYFEEIPADTFLFIGGTEPIPRKLVVSTLTKADAVRRWSDEFDSELTSSLAAQAQQGKAEKSDHSDKFKLGKFVLDQMGGAISADGLEKLGISASPRVAFYAVGTVPVFRFELSDPKKFTTFVDKFEQASHQPGARLERQGKHYRRYQSPGKDADVLLRITDKEAIIAAPKKSTLQVFLPYFVGIKKPKKSLADDNQFLRIVQAHGFKRFGAGYLDVQRLISYATGTTQPKGETKAILDHSDFMSKESAGCKRDFMRLAHLMPRLVGGFRQYSDQATDLAVGVDLDPELARQFAQTVSGTPGFSTAYAQQSMLQIGLGFSVGKLLDFMANRARTIQAKPFACDTFQDINQNASKMLAMVGQVPPAVRQVAGFNLLVHGLTARWQSDGSKSGKTFVYPQALAMLRTDQAEALMFLVGNFMPVLSKMHVKPDGKPVAFPQPPNAYAGIVQPRLMMTSRGLAAFIGSHMVEDTRKLLASKETATSPAFVLRLNLGKPARDFVHSVDKVIDQAAADRKARGLTAQDIAGARKAVAVMKDAVPRGRWTATIAAEVSDTGVLFSYRDEGKLPFKWGADLLKKNEENFDALERVLEGDKSQPAAPTAATPSPQKTAPAPTQPAQPVQPTK